MYVDYKFDSIKEAAESYGVTEEEIRNDFWLQENDDGTVTITYEEY